METRQTEKAFFPTYIQGNAKMIPFGYTVKDRVHNGLTYFSHISALRTKRKI